MADYKTKVQKLKDLANQYTAATRQDVIEKELKVNYNGYWNDFDQNTKLNMIETRRQEIRAKYNDPLKQAKAELQHEASIAKDEFRLKKQKKESGLDLIHRYSKDHHVSIELAKSLLDDMAAKNRGFYDPEDYTHTYIALKKQGTEQGNKHQETARQIDNMCKDYMKDFDPNGLENELKGLIVYLDAYSIDDLTRTCAYMGLASNPIS
jgi:hypothetical protein